MKKVLFYCQHTLGMGHFIRSSEIVRVLAREFAVTFLNGGEIVPGFELPAHVNVINLPALITDSEFRDLHGTDAATSVNEVKRQRLERIIAAYDRHTPDVVVIELFPFGRRKFAYELLPLLQRARRDRAAIVCSLRDILVQKRDQARFEEQVVDLVNTYFDLVLVHADPAFQTLQETFNAVERLRCPVVYTGFVAAASTAPPAATKKVESDTPRVVASVGGGRVGHELLHAAIRASALLQTVRPHTLEVFTGPYSPPDQHQAIVGLASRHPHIVVERYTPDLKSLLKRASLSVSMAGYNTCIDIVSSGVPSLVLPFAGNNNDEQHRRAEKLEKLGALQILRSLDPLDVCDRMAAELDRHRPQGSIRVDLSGAERTADLIRRLASHGTNVTSNKVGEALESLERCGRQVNVFFRDDDFADDNPRIRRLLDLAAVEGAPLSLAVIPGTLTDQGTCLLQQSMRARDIVEPHQHGFRHTNHEIEGRKSEFGGSRSYEQQARDLREGQAILLERLGKNLLPAFTPPWNRCDSSCERALDELGFTILSRDLSHPRAIGRRFAEIPVTIDLFTWKNGPVLRTWSSVEDQLAGQLLTGQTIGILLHHKVMEPPAFDLLRRLIRALSGSNAVKLKTLGTVSRAVPA